jgi:hypothetical protein
VYSNRPKKYTEVAGYHTGLHCRPLEADAVHTPRTPTATPSMPHAKKGKSSAKKGKSGAKNLFWKRSVCENTVGYWLDK